MPSTVATNPCACAHRPGHSKLPASCYRQVLEAAGIPAVLAGRQAPGEMRCLEVCCTSSLAQRRQGSGCVNVREVERHTIKSGTWWRGSWVSCAETDRPTGSSRVEQHTWSPEPALEMAPRAAPLGRRRGSGRVSRSGSGALNPSSSLRTCRHARHCGEQVQHKCDSLPPRLAEYLAPVMRANQRHRQHASACARSMQRPDSLDSCK